jgi:hypothetical protein
MPEGASDTRERVGDNRAPGERVPGKDFGIGAVRLPADVACTRSGPPLGLGSPRRAAEGDQNLEVRLRAK